MYQPVVGVGGGAPLAVVCVRGKKRGMSFNRSDAFALAQLAKQVAVVLRNVERHEGVLEVARSREVRHRQMANLNSIRAMHLDAMAQVPPRPCLFSGLCLRPLDAPRAACRRPGAVLRRARARAQVAAHTPLNAVMRGITDALQTLLDCEAVRLHLLQGGGTLVRSLGATAFQDQRTELAHAPSSDMVARCARDGQAVLVDLDLLSPEARAALAPPRATPVARGETPAGGGAAAPAPYEVDGVVVRNALAIPLRGEGGEAFAVVQLVNKAGGATPFSGSDELLVHMAAGALESVLDAALLTEVAPSPHPDAPWGAGGGSVTPPLRKQALSRRAGERGRCGSRSGWGR